MTDALDVLAGVEASRRAGWAKFYEEQRARAADEAELTGRPWAPDRRKRDPYAHVGAAARRSLEKAIAGGATNAERSVLLSAFYWLVTYSRLSDGVSLGQIAQAAGLWDGPASECPRSVTRVVSQRLRRLQELGCIQYTPGGRWGRGHPSRISLAPEDG